MNEYLIRRIPYSTPDGCRTLEYTLLADMPGPGVPGGTLYGIRISMYDAAGALADEAERFGLTPCRETAVRYLDLLIRNTVSPCTLQDVLDDLTQAEP